MVCAQSVLLNLATLANVVEEPEAESPAAIKLMLQVRRRLCANPAVSVDTKGQAWHVSFFRLTSGMKSPSMVQVSSEEDADRPVKVFMDMDHPTPTTPALSPKVPDIHSLST